MTIPAYMFNAVWLEMGFLFPVGKSERTALKYLYETCFSELTRSTHPNKEWLRIVLQARIATLTAYDFVVDCNAKTLADFTGRKK